MRALCQDERFIQYSKAFSDGLMNLDFFYDIAEAEFPFDFDTACKELEQKTTLSCSQIVKMVLRIT